MAGNEAPQCANPACARSVPRPATGRPARYCSDRCRQAGHRERVRQAGEAAQRAARLAAAQSTCARTWRPLEEATYEVGEAARAVLTYTADDAHDASTWHTRYVLGAKLGELRDAVGQLETLALRYRDAADEVARLGPSAQQDARSQETARRHPV